MRFARARFTTRSLMAVLAITAVLAGGVILSLRYSAAPRWPVPSRSNGGVIMEGVEINRNGAGRPERARRTGEANLPPVRLLPPELHTGRQP
jgi:hypothetical protein